MKTHRSILIGIGLALLMVGCSSQSKPARWITVYRLYESPNLAAYVITQGVDQGEGGFSEQIFIAKTLNFSLAKGEVELRMNSVTVMRTKGPPERVAEGARVPQEVLKVDELVLSLPSSALVLFNGELVRAVDLPTRNSEGMTEYVGEEAEKALRGMGLAPPTELDVDALETNKDIPGKLP